MLAPTALSLIAVTFRDQRGARHRLRGLRRGGGSGAAAGLLLGGTLTEYLQWRWCLYVNIVIAAAAFVAGRAVLPDPPAGSGGRLQVADAALITGGIAAVVLGARRRRRTAGARPR